MVFPKLNERGIMMDIFWIKEYREIKDVIPIDDPYRKGKIQSLKEALIGNFLLLVFCYIILGVMVYFSFQTSKWFLLWIFTLFPFFGWLLSLGVYFLIKKYHHPLLTLKKKYSLMNISNWKKNDR